MSKARRRLQDPVRSADPRATRAARKFATIWIMTAMLSWQGAAVDLSSAMLASATQLPTTQDGRNLPPNTWVQLSTVPARRFIPKGFTDCTQAGVLSHPVGRRASSIVYGGGIFYWGGAGQSYPANDVELFDIASNTWTQQYQPDCLPACCTADQTCDNACLVMGGAGTTELTPLGRPYVEHAVQLVTYNPLRQRYTAALTPGLWEWDPSTKEWTQLTPDRPLSTDLASKMLMYDPDVQTVLYFATTQYNHTVFAFDYGTNTWVAHGPIPPEVTWSSIFGAYDSNEHKYLISHGTGAMWIYDAIAEAWTQLENVPAAVALSESMAYDPVAGVFLLAKPDGAMNVQLWSYRISSDTWTQLAPAGEVPNGPTPLYNGLVYDSVWKRFYFLNVRSIGGGGQGGSGESDVETWAYRIGGPAGPGDVNCDGGVGAADVPSVVQLIVSHPAVGCGVADINRDGIVNEVDLSLTLDAIFGAPR